jgi:hypothetical protein
MICHGLKAGGRLSKGVDFACENSFSYYEKQVTTGFLA